MDVLSHGTYSPKGPQTDHDVDDGAGHVHLDLDGLIASGQ
jgi:hypothetical protein